MKALGLSCLVLLSLCGCPGGGDGGGSSDGGSQSGLGDGPWDPESCSPMAQMQTLPGMCTQADFDTWNTCVIDACEGQLSACYGPGYRSGTYSGACAPFVECAVDCQCSDSSCTSACPGAQPCADCLQMHLCGGDCKLDCAYAGTGIDTTKTCDDLLRCCASLSDAADRGQCADSANMLNQIAGGDVSCSALYGVFAASNLCM